MIWQRDCHQQSTCFSSMGGGRGETLSHVRWFLAAGVTGIGHRWGDHQAVRARGNLLKCHTNSHISNLVRGEGSDPVPLIPVGW